MAERFPEANLEELKRLEPIIRTPGPFNYSLIPYQFYKALGMETLQITGSGAFAWFYKNKQMSSLEVFSVTESALWFLNKVLGYQLNVLYGHPYSFQYHAGIRNLSMGGSANEPIMQFHDDSPGGTEYWYPPHDTPARAIMACAIQALIYEIERERFGEEAALSGVKTRREEEAVRLNNKDDPPPWA